MFTFGQKVHVGPFFSLFFIVMFGEMICTMLGTRVNRYSDQQKIIPL